MRNSKIKLQLSDVSNVAPCLEPGKIDALKMLDLQTKSAIDSDNFQV
jgi:hypothetical protein